MSVLPESRASFLVDFISPEIIDFLNKRLAAKNITFPVDINSFQAKYYSQIKTFYDQVFAGKISNLPPSNLVGLAINELRQVDLKKSQMKDLQANISFDENNNLLVQYVVDQQSSLDDWASDNHLDSEKLKGMIDSFFLEFFNENGMQLENGKLYHTKDGSLVSASELENILNNSSTIKEKLKDSNVASNVNIESSSDLSNRNQSYEDLINKLNI